MRNLIIVAALALVAGAGFYAFGPYPPFWVKSNIRSSMIEWAVDPSSLQLENVRYSSKDSNFVCGMMNAKNRMGAYTGFKKFAYSQDKNFTFLEGIDPSADMMIEMFDCN